MHSKQLGRLIPFHQGVNIIAWGLLIHGKGKRGRVINPFLVVGEGV